MFVVTGGRASGKTEAVIRWLREDPSNRAVLVADRTRAHYFLDRLRTGPIMHKYDWRPHVLSATDFQIGGYGRGWRHAFHFPQVAVDDMEAVFQVMFGVSLEFATMSATWIPLGSVSPDPIKAEVINNELPWSNPDHDVIGDLREAKRRLPAEPWKPDFPNELRP